jgi:hypothetical protein
MLSFFMPITYGAMIMTNYEEVGKDMWRILVECQPLDEHVALMSSKIIYIFNINFYN